MWQMLLPRKNHQGSLNTKDRWVVNLSSKPLSQVERRLLTHRPNFAVTSRSPPIIQCVTAIEEVCQKLERGEAEELRGEVKAILKKVHPPQTQHHLGRTEGHGRTKKRYDQDSTDRGQRGGFGSHEPRRL